MLFLLLLILFSNIYSIPFSTTYVEFDLPKTKKIDFDVINKDNVYYIYPNLVDGKKDFIIIVYSTSRLPQDNYDDYLEFFKKKFKGITKKGKVDFVKIMGINDNDWFVAQFKNSEALGYLTRYLIYLIGDRVILILFNLNLSSPRKDFYETYMYKIMSTITIPSSISYDTEETQNTSGAGLIGYLKGQISNNNKKTHNIKVVKRKKTTSNEELIKKILFFILGFIIIILILKIIIKLKKRRKKGFF